MTQETFTFQAEVGKLLDIVAHSLYSHKEIFLRELISNASDACDKLRYAALTDEKLAEASGGDFAIALKLDSKKKTLTVSDNGIGMSRDELNDLLGTIARSGTQAFAEQISKNNADKDKKDKDTSALIGQFGVGFYSSFMVADKVEVLTRKAGDEKAWLWESDGRGSYTIADAERETSGTDIIVHIKKADKEYLEPMRITNIVKTYSDHVGVPVTLAKEEGELETLNTASALWGRDKKDITPEQYTEFYHHVAHAFDEPWLTLHNRVEGVMSYTNLLYVPTAQPFNLFNPERKNHVKLYVNRVFITDDCEELLPSYLRFVQGVIDSEDLSLNISREMMQHDPKLAKIRTGLVKRILGELKKKAEKSADEYANFWGNFGAVLKEGLYEDFESREKLLEICRFRSTESDELISLAQYVERMKDGQEAIYFITGEDQAQVARSPQLEGFKSKGIEVLLLTDPIDDFWIQSVGSFMDKTFKSATRAGSDLDSMGEDKKDEDAKDDAKTDDAGVDALVARLKVALGETVKDVRASSRLTSSAVCLVSDEGDMDMHMERILKQHKQMSGDTAPTPRILEINPKHGLILKLSESAKASTEANPAIDDAAHLLLDQARILEGEAPADPLEFARRVSQMMERGLSL
ncbi:MAG: molecular chaperone HtpG [Rhodospirillales bacterium]|jgi:molecular chaperone HtpG|nr:molecular chaperone HtpG [Rhodospirillales bacterium]